MTQDVRLSQAVPPAEGRAAPVLPRPMFGAMPFVASTTLALGILLCSVTTALADTPVGDTAIIRSTADALVKLLVVALLLESGLNALFSWRVYQAIFDGRGWKTVVMVAASWLLVSQAHLTWVADLLAAYGGTVERTDLFMQILTALILAGGSNGIYNLLVRLGFRSPMQIEAVQAKPPPGTAWVSVSVKRNKAVGSILVALAPVEPQPSPLPIATAGVVGSGTGLGRLKGLFFRDAMRFPQSAGYAVEPGVAYALQVSGKAADGTAVPLEDLGRLVFARGAIVDIDVVL